MHNRQCPFCRRDSFRTIGVRVDEWVKCLNCRSIFRDVTPDRAQQIHDEAFQDSEFIDAMLAAAGTEPLHARWERLELPGSSVLEIGPGTGHMLAAAKQAGCAVEAVESSKVHRDYIRDTWGIDSLYPTMDEIPAGRTFDTIVCMNVFEHVYDVLEFLRAVRRVLTPGGTFFIATPNASSLEATWLGAWWSMCKVPDHFCFPSSAGLTTAARECGLQVEQTWTGGFPFEFPVSVLVAARDRIRAGRGTGPSPAGERPAGGGNPAAGNPATKAALNRFFSVAAPFDPAYRAIGALGRAASIRARLTC